ncbi:MAG TPA: M28 family peptidase [Terriglobales bacterium]|nr:M28 family peptidase [Terriglobales bacterium]
MTNFLSYVRKPLVIVLMVTASVLTGAAQAAPSKETVCKSCMEKDIRYLASDDLRGRGSATEDELRAAKYIAAIFQKLGLEPPAGKDYIIPVKLTRKKFVTPPRLKFKDDGKETVWTHGKEMICPRLTGTDIKGKIAKIDTAGSANVPEGSIVVVTEPVPEEKMREVLGPLLSSNASAVIIQASGPFLKNWDRYANQPASLPTVVEGEENASRRVALIAVKAGEMKTLAKLAAGTEVTISGTAAEDDQETRNVVGVLRGSDPTLKAQYVMFSAHMDHLGICAKTGDTICNGADDDASGTATVLELARIFTSGPRPKRSVAFATFGSEELGLLGSRGMAAKPPFPLNDFVADIEFEQTALPESKVGGKEFWMTGSQLSDLRSLLVQHGSQLADDPFPGNPFFRASDNYSFAEKGVVAHTMGGAAEFPDYHQPGDEAQKLNYDFLATSLRKVLPGLEWLVNSDVKPKYEPGKNPAGE